MKHDLTRSPSLRVELLLPTGLLALFGMTLAGSLSQPLELAAAGGERAQDMDGDGLPDAQERVVGTMLRVTDSDGDGFSDAEELARHSSPRTAHSIPEPRPIDVGISAHARKGGLHVLVMVYSADGTLTDKNMTLLASTGERVFELSGNILARRAHVESQPARDPDARIFAIDFEIHPKFVYAAGQLSFSAAVAAPSTGEHGVADVLDLVAVDRAICIRFSDIELGLRQSANSTSTSNSSSSGPTTTNTKLGGVYVPIYVPDRLGSDDPPGSTATPGEVCVQETVVVGSGGGMIVSEIVSAECVSGWDGFCGPSCAAQIGSTVRSIDPVIFTGG